MVNEPIRGQVAQILNSRELVINRGSDHGVKVEMVFAVKDPKGDSVKDPETGETLGSVFRPKVEVKIVEVQQRISVGRTFRSRRNPQSLGHGLFSDLLIRQGATRIPETLRSDDAIWEDLSESDSYVKIGDPVLQVILE